MVALEWEERIKTAHPINLHALIGLAIKEYQASTVGDKGAVLAIVLETMLSDPDGVGHPCYEDAQRVMAHVGHQLDAFTDHTTAIKKLAKHVRKSVPKDRWLQTLSLCIKKLVSAPLAKSTIENITKVIETDLESIALSALRHASHFFHC